MTDFSISNAGVSLSATGSSVTGGSGYLAVTPAYVFATDGTNIITYSRNSNGGLTQASSVNGVEHNITPNGSGVGPLTVDRTGQTLYAAEINYDGADDDAYSVWTIGSNGTLAYDTSVGINVDYNTFLSFTQNNQYAYGYGCYFISWDIFGFMRGSDGMLTPFDPQAQIPPGNGNQMFCPGPMDASAQNYLAVSYVDASTPGSNYLLAIYTINSDGTLGLVQNSETTTAFAGVSGVAFDPTGQYLAVASTTGIQMYALQSGGLLTPVGSVVDGNVSFVAVKWDNSHHLYAISNSGLYVFTSNAGTLAQAPGSPLPLSNAATLAVSPTQ